jgi:hypothetical protein
MSAHEAPGAPITPIRRQPATFEELVERRVTLKADLEFTQAQLEQIDDEIRTRGVGTHEAGAWSVQVRPSRRLDAKAVEAAYPVAQNPELYKPAIDTAAIKDHIAPKDLDQFYVENRPSIVVK